MRIVFGNNAHRYALPRLLFSIATPCDDIIGNSEKGNGIEIGCWKIGMGGGGGGGGGWME